MSTHTEHDEMKPLWNWLLLFACEMHELARRCQQHIVQVYQHACQTISNSSNNVVFMLNNLNYLQTMIMLACHACLDEEELHQAIE